MIAPHRMMMKWQKRLGRLLVFVGLCGLASCARDPVVIVNQVPITRNALLSAARVASRNHDIVRLQDTQRAEAFKQYLLEQLIDDELLRQAAGAAGVQLSTKELNAFLDAHKGNYSEVRFAAMLEEKGIDEATWRTQRKQQLLVDRYIARTIAPDVAITEKAIAQYYDEHPEDFRRREAVHARQILVTDQKTANKLRKELRAGGDFARLAVEHSISPEAAHGGDLGWIERGQFPAVFESIAFRLPIGQLSQVIESPYGFHIFEVLGRSPSHTLSLEEAHDEIGEMLQMEAISEAFELRLEELRSAAKIDMQNDVLARVDIRRALTPKLGKE